VVLCSPRPIADEILYDAQLCGVQEVFQIAGTKAMVAMAFVTEAKRQISQRLYGAAIDMPAGPSEVLLIADADATPTFVACDLLSQAEHGADSQVILVTPDAAMPRWRRQ